MFEVFCILNFDSIFRVVVLKCCFINSIKVSVELEKKDSICFNFVGLGFCQVDGVIGIVLFYFKLWLVYGYVWFVVDFELFQVFYSIGSFDVLFQVLVNGFVVKLEREV